MQPREQSRVSQMCFSSVILVAAAALLPSVLKCRKRYPIEQAAFSFFCGVHDASICSKFGNLQNMAYFVWSSSNKIQLKCVKNKQKSQINTSLNLVDVYWRRDLFGHLSKTSCCRRRVYFLCIPSYKQNIAFCLHLLRWSQTFWLVLPVLTLHLELFCKWLMSS